MGDSVAVAHQKGRRDLGGALIVHPSYLHTLAIPPVSLRPELCWADLPPEVVRLVLLSVDCHRALCNFAAVSRECRCVCQLRGKRRGRGKHRLLAGAPTCGLVAWVAAAALRRPQNSSSASGLPHTHPPSTHPRRDIASDDLLWRPLCLRHFNCPDFVEPESWRELFR